MHTTTRTAPQVRTTTIRTIPPRYVAAADAASYLGVGLTHFTNVIRPQLPFHNLSNPASDRQIIRWSVADLDAFAAVRRVA